MPASLQHVVRVLLVRPISDLQVDVVHNLFNALASAMTGRVPELAVAVAAALDASADFREGWFVSVKDQLLDPRTPQATYLQVCCALTRTLQQLCLQRCSAGGLPCVVLDTTASSASQAGFSPILVEAGRWPCPPPSTTASPLLLDADADLRPPSWLLLPASRRFFRAGIWHDSRERWNEAQRLVHDFARPSRDPLPLLEELLALVLCSIANPTSMGVVSAIDIVMPEWRSLLASQARLTRAYHRAIDNAGRSLADAQRQVPLPAAPPSSSFRSAAQRAAATKRSRRELLERSKRVLATACTLSGLDLSSFKTLKDLERLASHQPRLRAMMWAALARTCGTVEALRLGWVGSPAPPLVHAMMGYGAGVLAAKASELGGALAAPDFFASLYAPEVRPCVCMCVLEPCLRAPM